MIISNI